MATIKPTSELAVDAATLASSFEYVLYRKQLYAPVDYVDGDTGVVPPVERKAWVPLTEDALGIKALDQFQTLFKEQRQTASFRYMVEQLSTRVDEIKPWLLIKTEDGLKVLREDGKRFDPDGSFVPNIIQWTINDDPGDKAALLQTITDWVGGDADVATSLLRHLATALAPHWSAGRYVLLIGNGRNGKSLLMNMLMKLFGHLNCSGVTRQEISDAEKSLFDLNNKLLNVVLDGPAVFLKDSGREKSLITGEQIGIRKLYTNTSTPVQTNALFIEGLNQEPRSRDKSSALQARLVRFWFPNRYPDDKEFWDHMLSEQMLGALMSLLLDNYVQQQDVAWMLAPTMMSKAAQIEHLVDNSLALQWLIHLDETQQLPVNEFLLDMEWSALVQQFQLWRQASRDPTPWDSQSVLNLFRPVLDTERKGRRVNGQPRQVRVVTGLTDDAQLVVNSLREDPNAIEEEEDTDATAVVDDGQV